MADCGVTLSLSLFSCPLWTGVSVPVMVPSMIQIELFNLLRWIIIISYLKACSCHGTGMCVRLSCELIFMVFVNDRGLDKWLRQVDRYKFRFYLATLTQTCIDVEIAVVVSRQRSLCWMLKVYIAESLRLSRLLLCGDSSSRRRGWSQCLVQILGVVVWSGCRCCWRRSMMWAHWLQRLDDRCLGCAVLWLTRRRCVEVDLKCWC